ncbi:ATP synthase complex subunit H [Geopyxis carbonaria]|nr:ATP synthase complex subunit H [Geopyxis carbonaria]
MLAHTLRVTARSALARPAIVARRGFVVPTAARKADAVQSIYLQALKDYKPKPESASAAEGVVKKWAAPAAPAVPETVDAAELAAYKASAVEVEGQEPAAGGVVAAKEEDWFEEEVAFAEEEPKH